MYVCVYIYVCVCVCCKYLINGVIYIYIERVNLYLDVLFTFYHYMRQNVYVLHNISSSSYSFIELLIYYNSTIRNIIILLGIDYNSMHAIILD